MQKHNRTRLLVLILSASVAGCAHWKETPPGSTGVSPISGNNGASGIVLSGPDLYEHGGTLLSYLHARISGMTVSFETQPCPSVTIRGRKSLYGSNDPVVYLDGNRAANSCILEMLHTRDLDRVEVYPMGVSNRPGYEAHPNGLILVFALDAPRSFDPARDKRGLSDFE